MTASRFGRPTAEELVAAVADFLESDVGGATSGQVNFHARVAANVLRIVGRQLGAEPRAPLDEQDLLAQIRDGALAGHEAAVRAALRAIVYDRLEVAHPGYALESLADRLFGAIETGDLERVAAMWSDEILVWHAGDTRPSAKARALRVIKWLLAETADRRYDVLDRRFFDGGFVQQHRLHGLTRSGTTYSLRVGMVICVGRDGLITRIDEYFDPADLAPILNQP